MKSPLCWIGGKSLLAEEICARIPAHKHYVETFTGAGWVFFRKPPSKFETLNDINGDLIAFYRVLQHHLEEFCRQFKWLLASRELFTDFKAQAGAGGLTDIQRAARFYYLQRQAFGGKVTGRTFGGGAMQAPRVNLLRIEEELSAAHLRLAGTVVEHLDWRDCLRRYDTPETFFYLDPPYWGTEDFYGKDLFSRDDYAEMAEILDGLQGRFLLSLNDVPGVRDVFGRFRIDGTSTRYSCGREEVKQVREVFISNYEPTVKKQASLLDMAG